MRTIAGADNLESGVGWNVHGASPVFDTSVPALILKVGFYPFHQGGLGIIRSLGRVGVPTYGMHEQRLAPAAASRYLAGRFV